MDDSTTAIRGSAMDPAIVNENANGQCHSPDPSNQSALSIQSPQSSSQPAVKRKRREPPPRPVAAYPRKRAVAACRLCRARKIKCNNARPSCGGCLGSGAQCVYEDSEDQSALDPASILILDRLNQVLSRLDVVAPAAAPAAAPAVSPASLVETLTVSSPGYQPVQDGSSQSSLWIPSACTTADAILKWPIFEGRYEPDYITNAVFLAEDADESSDHEADSPALSLGLRRQQLFSGRPRSIDEDAIPSLVQRFLDRVHIKNPILDVDVVWSITRRVAEEGLSWDLDSCLVLIASALGCVAQPFASAAFPVQGTSSLEAHADSLQQGEAYYALARRRLGLLDRGIRVSQCHFLVGVYLMYTMRPLSAWSQFRIASQSYRMYLESRARRPPSARTADSDAARRRWSLEQRLYWSCYKSECELRSEMDLPNSLLADCDYPDMHPSPPEPPSPAPRDAVDDTAAAGSYSRPAWLHQHHEQSWFYYLTEITVRRIGNRILQMMYAGGHAAWTADAIPSLAKTAREFYGQLQQWHDDLPAPIRSKNDEVPTEELPGFVRARILLLRSWVCRPFLYYIIHSPLDAPHRDIALPFAEKELRRCLAAQSSMMLLHRHHGTFYAVLGAIGNALLVLAAVKSGRLPVPLDWKPPVLFVIEHIRFWEDECPSIARGRLVLEDYMSAL